MAIRCSQVRSDARSGSYRSAARQARSSVSWTRSSASSNGAEHPVAVRQQVATEGLVPLGRAPSCSTTAGAYVDVGILGRHR